MSEQAIVPMTPALAEELAAWEYPGEYAIYNWQEGEPLDEMLDGSTYGVLNIAGELIGFYQFGQGAQIPTAEELSYPEGPLDMGLGLRPDLCGAGLGKPFVQAGMKFAKTKLQADMFRLTVAAFNRRAQKVYSSCGFVTERTVTHGITGEGFLVMLNTGQKMLRYLDTLQAEDYCRLRAAVGWSPICPAQAEAGLEGSAFVVGCYDEELAVGSARVIWDGGYSAYLTNVMVLPDYQGVGIGTKLVEHCLEFLRAQLRPGWRIKVQLQAGKDRTGFYEQFGFARQPGEDAGPAMEMWVE